jgi:hypothetical protein
MLDNVCVWEGGGETWRMFKKQLIKLYFVSKLTNSVALVREQTIPTERPPLVGEVSANFADRGVSHGQCGGSPTAVILVLYTDFFFSRLHLEIQFAADVNIEPLRRILTRIFLLPQRHLGNEVGTLTSPDARPCKRTESEVRVSDIVPTTRGSSR